MEIHPPEDYSSAKPKPEVGVLPEGATSHLDFITTVQRYDGTARTYRHIVFDVEGAHACLTWREKGENGWRQSLTSRGTYVLMAYLTSAAMAKAKK